jgi:glycosyltransferase involved in cell wall biosynthesis
VKLVGTPDQPGFETHLREILTQNRSHRRVEFLGRVSDDELLSLYANAFAVYYAPHDEDYGFVTLEAFASGKPVVTATDSGGVLDFVEDGKNGIVSAPAPEAIAGALNSLLDERRYQELTKDLSGAAAFFDWDEIVRRLTA